MTASALPDAGHTVADFDFHLPPDLIAQHPLADRAASRLLHVTPTGYDDRLFADIDQLLRPGDLAVLNDTKVIKARLLGRKPSGGKVEALIERIVEPDVALALVRTSHTLATGSRIVFDGTVSAIVEGRRDDFFILRFECDLATALEQHGRVPLPPYIDHPADAFDEQRYQTVYAAQPGAVAAPTAGLHFDEAVLGALQRRGVELVHVTLHVGAGTFQPVRVEHLADHRMHAEHYRISASAADAINQARASRRRLVAVGTTSLRALESAVDASGRVRAGAAETSLFITPGYRFRLVDVLLTNFHLPRSTLLMLVSAFAGVDRIRAAYAHAIDQRYRFFSYGDAMLLQRAQ